MPESPEMMEEVGVELPDLPSREGESQAALRLEDRRRKDSEIEELRAALKRLEGTSVNEMRTKYASSPSARRRQISARKKIDELNKLTFKRGDRWEGPCAPATIINFNPVPLTLTGGDLARWTVPEAGKGNPINIRFRGRLFVGSYMTIKDPHLYGSHTGTQNDKQSGVDMPSVEYKYIPPWGLVHQFYSHYVRGSADAQNMGGIVIFEGDIHTLDEKRLQKNDGMIWVPKKEITLDGFGDVVYVVEEHRFIDAVEEAVTLQQRYADAKINEGHSYATSQSEIIRNQLNGDHRTWHNYALKMGYLEKALPWATERLADKPTVQAVFCPDCHERQAAPEQFFCSNCNAPFDALKAYLAGKSVSPDRLAIYEGEDWDAILAETKRRQAKIAMLTVSEDTPKPKSGRGGGGGAQNRGEEPDKTPAT